MATGEQLIAKGTVWQELTGVVGAVILQNNSASFTVQYFVGSSAPSTQMGVNIRPLNEHAPNVKPSETAYARCLHGAASIAWSE